MPVTVCRSRSLLLLSIAWLRCSSASRHPRLVFHSAEQDSPGTQGVQIFPPQGSSPGLLRSADRLQPDRGSQESSPHFLYRDCLSNLHFRWLGRLSSPGSRETAQVTLPTEARGPGKYRQAPVPKLCERRWGMEPAAWELTPSKRSTHRLQSSRV